MELYRNVSEMAAIRGKAGKVYMWDIIIDTLADGVKLLPFLFIAYLVMEYMEHKMAEGAKRAIEKAGRFGPLFGGMIGIFPQCGFSAAASNLYAGKVITLGTLIAVFLSTSDEMLPILISEHVNAGIIFRLLGLKALLGVIAGFMVDFFAGGKYRDRHTRWERLYGHMDIEHLCEHEHCRCEDGIVKSALRHTLNIFLFLLLVTFLLNVMIDFAGGEFFTTIMLNRPFSGHMIAGLIGLIPNCASSVMLTQLYLKGVIGLGIMMSGLLAGTGAGLIVLFRINDDKRENIRIVSLLYIIGVAAGISIDLFM